MKVAIISDTHDNLPNLKKAIDWIEKEKIKIIIHCGDVCSVETLREIAQTFSGKLHLVFGNIDETNFHSGEKGPERLFSNVIFHGKKGEIEIGKKKAAFTHLPESARELALTGEYNLVFYGHSHRPWEEEINGCRLINPGNLAGVFYKATFAVYDTKNEELALKILEKLL